jgi:scyllo-inositol 2-dehydrogenase (NADP+)
VNEPIKTGIASFGMSGQIFHAPLLHSNPRFEINAIVERSKEVSREKYGYSKLVRSFDELVQDKEIELIIVNTPDKFHYEHAKQAINAGKHLAVEKPFTQNYSDALELIELAKSKKVILSVFQNRRWDSDFLTLQNVISSGKLGKLVSFESHFDRYKNFIQENTWKEDPNYGAGIVFNLGSHMIDQALVLFGKPSGVIAEIRTLRTDGKTDDFFDINLEYPTNISVSVRGSLLVKEAGPRYILHGTEGSFLKWGIDTQEQELKEGKIPGSDGWGDEKPEYWGVLNTNAEGVEFRGNIESVPGDYSKFYNELYSAIRHGAQAPVLAEDAALVIRIINAAFESSKKGIKVLI